MGIQLKVGYVVRRLPWLRSRLHRVDYRVRVVNAPAKTEAFQCAVGGVANIERGVRA